MKNKPTPSLLASNTKLAKEQTTLEGLAELSFPQAKPTTKRPRLNLAIAIDASGSMSCYMAGASALDHAKAATLSLIERLDGNDRIAIVAYSTEARVLVPSMSVSDAKATVKQALANLRPMASTALHAGWLTAAQQAAPYVEQYDLSRVLLLSDGQATDGLCDEKELAKEAEKLLAAGISTSTYGLGMHFNEVLMTGMAAGGVARYAETADTLVPYFESDFAMLAQTVARSVKLVLTATNADTQEKLATSLLGGGKDDNGTWRLSAGVAGASSWAAFSVNVGQAKKVQLAARWEIEGLDGKIQVIDQDVALGRGKGKDNGAVAARIAEAKAAAAAEAAAEAARRGDRMRVNEQLGILRGLAGASAYTMAVSNHLADLESKGDLTALAKETMYASAAMSTRVVDTGERHDRLAADRFGMRKIIQGKAADNSNKS